MENTKIEWAHHTFNPWEGCAKVSPGCKNCYAEGQHKLHHAALAKGTNPGTCWGLGAPRLGKSEANWKQPLKWNRAAAAAGVRARVFCASMADVFEDQTPLSASFAGQPGEVPMGGGKTRPVRFVDLAAERLRLLILIYATPHLDWLLLTKRPEHIAAALRQAYERPRHGSAEALRAFNNWLAAWLAGTPPANVWLGTSIENQEQADLRIPHLLAAPAVVRFLSCEPLLGPVQLFENRTLYACQSCGEEVGEGEQNNGNCPHCGGTALDPVGVCEEQYEGIDWVIVGGESGPKARPMHPDWARGLRDQCEAAGVAFHFKQWGEYKPFYPSEPKPDGIGAKGRTDWHNWPGGVVSVRLGKHEAGRLLDGRTWDEVPAGKEVARA